MSENKSCCEKCKNEEIETLPPVVGYGGQVYACNNCDAFYLEKNGELVKMPIKDIVVYLTLLALTRNGFYDNWDTITKIKDFIKEQISEEEYETPSYQTLDSLIFEEINKAFEIARANPIAYPPFKEQRKK